MLNFNVGVLGHVDSGKTSLVKALSTVASTAAFDKNPQSKERGITLDLGFSSFVVELPAHVKNQMSDGDIAEDKMQITLVDCPGHASLIRTIIGGSQIIDMMLLVVDVVKGVQTQTAECLIIGEILCDKMIVVLNKTDLLPEAKRDSAIDKMKKRLSKTLERTRFKDCPIVTVSANPGALETLDPTKSLGITDLIEQIRLSSYLPMRELDKPALFSVDHCFSIKGQGTVMTGTILQGQIKVNDTLEIPHLRVTKKIKSMQMFRKPVNTAKQGDRLGICVTQFDPSLFERGYVCTPDSLRLVYAAIVSINRIAYYKLPIASKHKFHVTIGHDTVMASIQLFSTVDSTVKAFSMSQEFLYKEDLNDEDSNTDASTVFALLEFERAVVCPADALFISSKLDLDVNTTSCRIAFHGNILHPFTNEDYHKTGLPQLKVYKTKERSGNAERLVDDYSIIGRNLFKKETNIQSFVGLKVQMTSGDTGVIEGSFGQSGKFKVRLDNAASDGLKSALSAAGGKKGKSSGDPPPSSAQNIEIKLTFKRYIYDPEKKMKQTL